MQRQGWMAAAGAIFLLAGASLPAAESGRFELSVLIDGRPATEHPLRDLTYIEAVAGKSFVLRLHNPTRERVAVALSVDGLNVVDAKRTTVAGATKWVLEPGGTIEIPGWQVSGRTSRRFFFTDTARSYARWIGDPRNVGVIEAVFFREKAREVEPLRIAPGAPRQGAARGSAGESRAPQSSSSVPLHQSATPQSDRFAATGIGEPTDFPVQWVRFDEEPVAAASIALRYEFRRELVRLGVLPGGDELSVRDRARGFEHEYAPDPH